MVAMIGGAMAKTASNSFAEVSGEGVESDGEMGFVIKNVAGDVEITISERDGWKSGKESPYTYTHKEGDTDNFYFAGREGEESEMLALAELRDRELDMFCTVFIGNAETRELDGRMVTPRGYDRRSDGDDVR